MSKLCTIVTQRNFFHLLKQDRSNIKFKHDNKISLLTAKVHQEIAFCYFVTSSPIQQGYAVYLQLLSEITHDHAQVCASIPVIMKEICLPTDKNVIKFI